MRLLTHLMRDVRRRYGTDDVKPGLVLSELQYGTEFYASVCRYPSGAKVVVVSAKGDTLRDALEGLALAWLVHCGKVKRFRLAAKLPPRAFEAALVKAL